MRLRAHGTPEECRQVVEALSGIFRVVSVSDPYPDRGASGLVRVYLDIRLDDPPAVLRGPGQPRRRTR
jgi:hypothetical protein